ncbi:DUF4399 domain-containing protein [Moritella dasanensis]|uniref:DUF4399 domain-containing protein n=1 Tax=Moritella dasanensis TaxID=428031 RepID=UPI0002E45F73|nr:DUF4399 domain-containing protein [Moritella dasanensis]
MFKISLFFVMFMVSSNTFALKQEPASSAPSGVNVYIISPVDGATVSPTFTVRFGLSGMGIAPAGIDRDKTAHHHLLIDTKVLPDLTKPLQATDKVRHFGGGQTETEITLKPGKHTLQLLLGNYAHVPHDKPLMSKKITVIVK